MSDIHHERRRVGVSDRALALGFCTMLLGNTFGIVLGYQFDTDGEHGYPNAKLGLELAMVPTLLASIIVTHTLDKK